MVTYLALFTMVGISHLSKDCLFSLYHTPLVSLPFCQSPPYSCCPALLLPAYPDYTELWLTNHSSFSQLHQQTHNNGRVFSDLDANPGVGKDFRTIKRRLARCLWVQGLAWPGISSLQPAENGNAPPAWRKASGKSFLPGIGLPEALIWLHIRRRGRERAGVS